MDGKPGCTAAVPPPTQRAAPAAAAAAPVASSDVMDLCDSDAEGEHGAEPQQPDEVDLISSSDDEEPTPAQQTQPAQQQQQQRRQQQQPAQPAPTRLLRPPSRGAGAVRRPVLPGAPARRAAPQQPQQPPHQPPTAVQQEAAAVAASLSPSRDSAGGASSGSFGSTGGDDSGSGGAPSSGTSGGSGSPCSSGNSGGSGGAGLASPTADADAGGSPSPASDGKSADARACAAGSSGSEPAAQQAVAGQAAAAATEDKERALAAQLAAAAFQSAMDWEESHPAAEAEEATADASAQNAAATDSQQAAVEDPRQAAAAGSTQQAAEAGPRQAAAADEQQAAGAAAPSSPAHPAAVSGVQQAVATAVEDMEVDAPAQAGGAAPTASVGEQQRQLPSEQQQQQQHPEQQPEQLQQQQPSDDHENPNPIVARWILSAVRPERATWQGNQGPKHLEWSPAAGGSAAAAGTGSHGDGQQHHQHRQQQQRAAYEGMEVDDDAAVCATVQTLVAACEADAGPAGGDGLQPDSSLVTCRVVPRPGAQTTPRSQPRSLSSFSKPLQKLARAVLHGHRPLTPAVSTGGAASAGSSAAAPPSLAHTAPAPSALASASGAASPGPAGGSTAAAAVPPTGAEPADVAGGSGAAWAAAAAPPAAEQAAAPEGSEGDGMPDATTDAGALLRWARLRIPPELLQQYHEPFSITEGEKAETLRRLEVYESEEAYARRMKVKEAKFDLHAATKMPLKYPSWELWDPVHGHPRGVFPRQRFNGRGALKALGVHDNYYGGIHSTYGMRMQGKEPAFAVCLSGGYEDDEDRGDLLWYTGKGGRSETTKQQTKSQSFSGANAAIRACLEQGKPLRVCRGLVETTTVPNPTTGRTKTTRRPVYTYDGLYAVIKAGLYPTRDDPNVMVCKFLLVGIPGHYHAGKSISFAEGRGFRNMRLAATDDDDESDEEEGEEDERPYPKRQRTSGQSAAAAAAAASARRAAVTAPPRKKATVQKCGAGTAAAQPEAVLPEVVQDATWLFNQRRRPGFLTDDISGGRERRKIPAFNEVDDEELPADLEYVRESRLESDAARQLAAAAASVMPGEWCGREQQKNKSTYIIDGRMRETNSLGVWECCDSCAGRLRRCARNRVISDRGITQPLEVFRTRWKGWAVRSAGLTKVGTVVCTYEGATIMHAEADAMRDADSYLFDLDHFIQVNYDRCTREEERARLPPLPPCITDDNSNHLTVDAQRVGNIARFINHSCSPNLVAQAVLRPGDSGLRYGIAFVASCDIPPGTEFSYDYGYKVGTVAGKEIACHCGTANCRKRLI